MTFAFSVCSRCRDKYRALRYDPTCGYSLNVIPYCSLSWPDEHPNGRFCGCRPKCRVSIMRLAHARTQLWRNGEIPAEYRDLWNQAQAIIPNWPGFKRLTLDEAQMRSLDGCRAELEGLLNGITTFFPRTELTDEGGGLVGLVATRVPEKKARSAGGRSGSRGHRRTSRCT